MGYPATPPTVEDRGDHAVFFVRHKGQRLEVKIDHEDVPRILALGRAWQCSVDKSGHRDIVTHPKPAPMMKLHRWLLGFPSGKPIDHINHDTLDNRKGNLRICTYADNNLNRKGTRAGSGHRGVHYHPASGSRKWKADVQRNGKPLISQYFLTKEEAIVAVRRTLTEHGVPFE